jgi:hypothetical protein
LAKKKFNELPLISTFQTVGKQKTPGEVVTRAAHSARIVKDLKFIILPPQDPRDIRILQRVFDGAE